jgi:predicted secreted Zn-dependent protease
MNDNSWDEWGRHVLQELKRHDKNHEKLVREVADAEDRIKERIQSLHADITTLKAKAAIWGSIAGTIVACLVSAIVGMFFKQ